MFKISVTPADIEALKPGTFPGKIIVIDKPGEEMDAAIAYLKRQKVIGFDTESRPAFTPNSPRYGVSLIQLSGAGKAYLFRIKRCGIPEGLCRIFASKRIIKVGAAVRDDLRGIQKYTGFAPKSFVDLQQIVWEWGIKDKAVKKMAANILGIHISKREQLSNWEAENLSPSQQAYAATDAWVCREMYLKLLQTEKNPLTPEQMLPNPPAVKTEEKTDDQNNTSQRP